MKNILKSYLKSCVPRFQMIVLDAVSRQFKPCLTTGCVCTAAPLWCGLGCCFLTVVVILHPGWRKSNQQGHAETN